MKIGNAAGEAWEFLRGFFSAAAAEVVVNGRKMAEERVEELKTVGEWRDELFAFIDGLDDEAARRALRRRHRDRQECRPRSYGREERYVPTDENKLVERLVSLYRSLSEESETEARKNVFRSLGHMTDEEFDLAIEFCTNDWLVQHLRLAMNFLGSRDRDATATLFRHARRVRSSWWAYPHRIPLIGPFIDPVGFIRERMGS